jgi:hypothetical protein
MLWYERGKYPWPKRSPWKPVGWRQSDTYALLITLGMITYILVYLLVR